MCDYYIYTMVTVLLLSHRVFDYILQKCRCVSQWYIQCRQFFVLENLNNVILLIVHPVQEHAVPKVAFAKKFPHHKFKRVKDIVEIAFFETVYEHKFNQRAFEQLAIHFPKGKSVSILVSWR